MALSNIRVEPRREITESLLGITFFGVLVYLTFLLGVYMHNHSPANNPMSVPGGMLMGLIMIIFAVAGIMGFLYFTHFIGEIVSDWLEAAGLDLRPKQRYIRTYEGKIRKA